MTERIDKHPEALEAQTPEHHQEAEPKQDKVEASRLEAVKSEQLDTARETASKESSEVDKLLQKLEDIQETHNDNLAKAPINGSLKKITFDKEIRHIRRKLSKSDQLGSRVIHQPVVKVASDISSKTITRPSGLLGGGIVAFLGTSIYLYITKYIGLKYNYSIFLLLLVAGFVVGLLIEAVVRLTARKSV